MKKLQVQAIAIAGLIEAAITVALAFDQIKPEVAAGITGLVTAGLFAIRTFVTPVEKVAQLVEKPVGAVNDLLKGIKL